MRKDITIDGQEYELSITARRLVNSGRTSVSMSDEETEALLANNCFLLVDMAEYELIMEALNSLSESCEEEIKWAMGSKDILEMNRVCINGIEALQERLRNG